MTLLAMLRHAETDWSARKKLQGRTDIPLNETGRNALRGVHVPADCASMQVVSSPLQRCMQTADCLHLGSVRAEPRIQEMSWGAWEGLSLPALREELGYTMRANEERGLDFQPPGGESPRQVWARVQPWLAEVAVAGRPTLAVSHRGVIRVIFAAAMGWDMLGRPPAKLDWLCLQLFRLDTEGRPSVLRLNLPLDASTAGQPGAQEA